MHIQAKVDFTSDKGQKKLTYIEGLIKNIYKDQLSTREDLALRDKVITKIKDAFTQAADFDYPSLLTGEINISGFGSCQNGLWNAENSDIDVTAIFSDKLGHNQH